MRSWCTHSSKLILRHPKKPPISKLRFMLFNFNFSSSFLNSIWERRSFNSCDMHLREKNYVAECIYCPHVENYETRHIDTIIEGGANKICQRKIKTPFKKGIYALELERETEMWRKKIGKKIYVNLEVQMHASIHATVLIRQLK